MTTPNLAKSSGYGGRTYSWPPNPPHEFEVFSVTRAIGSGYPKPFLIPWAAKITAECAVENMPIIQAMLDKGDERGAIDYLKNARNRLMSAKADRGTIVHAAMEAYVKGQEMDAQELSELLEDARVPRNLWRGTKGMIDGVTKFLNEFEPEILWSENTVFSRQHGYAGTADLIAECSIEKDASGPKVPVIIDIKTSKSIYDDTAMQLAAYARADFVGLNDGTEHALVDGQSIDNGIVIRPTASGTYEPGFFSLNDDVFELFLNCLHIAANGDVLKQSRRP